MVNIMPENSNMIINPLSGDSDRAEDVIDEIAAILVKRGCCLIHKPEAFADQKLAGFVLAKIEHNRTLRALAVIREISPFKCEWRDAGIKKGNVQ